VTGPHPGGVLPPGQYRLGEPTYRALVEAAPDAILAVDPAGVVVLVNAQAERLFGYRRDELLGQQVEALVPHGVRTMHLAHRTRYVAEPTARPMGAGMQLSARRRDGTEFPAEISLSAVPTADGTLIAAAVRDVTDRIEAQADRERLRAQAERDRLESRLLQSQRLESLGQLAGGIAHDFNNLLGVILNYSTFVEEEIAAAAAAGDAAARWAPARSDLEQIRRAAERATELTHQLLSFGRREVVRPQVLNLNEVVADVQDMLRRTIGEHIELTTSLDPDLWYVLADPGKVEQILVNLAVNARDAMPGGGRLSIDTARVVVDADTAALRPGLKDGPHVLMRVTDSGCGMPPEIIRQAFEPFFTTKAKGEGTGLGLATVYGIVTQADGHVQISSTPGAGTTFTVLLPATDEQPDAVAGPAQGPVRSGGETVLVVEDADSMRELARRILDRNGYRVVTADGGDAALALAASDSRIDLLITDVIMPRMLGREVADRIRVTRPKLRVLYMTGYASPALVSQGSLEAAGTLIEKPFTELTLLAKVREVLDTPT
jgi:PAS domain S-box-containing protein